MEAEKVIRESVMYGFIVNFLKISLEKDDYISAGDIRKILIALGEIKTEDKEKKDE